MTTRKPIDKAKLTAACEALRSTVNAFIERAELADIKSMLERGVLVQTQMEDVAKVVTGTGVAP